MFAAIRRSLPVAVPPLQLSKAPLLALARAIEDEYLARGGGGVVIASFQSAEFYEESELRWRELARHSKAALVFADFDYVRASPGRAVEIPLGPDHPLLGEWIVACEAPGLSVCLIAREMFDPYAERREFEAIWTVEHEAVRAVLDDCLDVAAEQLPRLAQAVRAGMPALEMGGTSAVATAVAARMADYEMSVA